MKNKHTLLLGLVMVCTFGMAQRIDYKKIILPEGATDVSFEERLVQLAWQNNPAALMAEKEVDVAGYDARVVGARWSSILGAQGNLNEFTIKQLTNTGNNDVSNNQFYPRYNFYLSVPLSLFFELPNAKKSANAKVDVARERVNLLKLDIRARVLKLYNEFKKNEMIWNIRKESMADEESNFMLIEQKFRNGEIPVDEYMRAQKSRSDQKIQNILSENEYLRSKLDLEAVIGMKIEEIR